MQEQGDIEGANDEQGEERERMDEDAEASDEEEADDIIVCKVSEIIGKSFL